MSPLKQQIEQSHHGHADVAVSEMRRVSLSLAYSPARQRRRKLMAASDRFMAGGGLFGRLRARAQ